MISKVYVNFFRIFSEFYENLQNRINSEPRETEEIVINRLGDTKLRMIFNNIHLFQLHD